MPRSCVEVAESGLTSDCFVRMGDVITLLDRDGPRLTRRSLPREVAGLSALTGLLNLIPSLILFAIVQRYLISGLSSGAVKG